MDKYWIKKGIKVSHDDLPAVSLTVEKIIYKDVVQKDGNKKKFTIGVKCHWVYDGRYETGVFHTSELRPA